MKKYEPIFEVTKFLSKNPKFKESLNDAARHLKKYSDDFISGNMDEREYNEWLVKVFIPLIEVLMRDEKELIGYDENFVNWATIIGVLFSKPILRPILPKVGSIIQKAITRFSSRQNRSGFEMRYKHKSSSDKEVYGDIWDKYKKAKKLGFA